MTLKEAIKNIVPPVLWKVARRIRHPEAYGYFGNYSSWEEAQKVSGNYEASSILAKVQVAALKAKRGEVAFERDGVTFEKETCAWPLLACLLFIAGQNNGKLNLVDFGGSLGSSYFQHRKFLAALQEVRWSIVEQPHYVEVGKKDFEDGTLRFFDNIHGAVGATEADNIIFSSVLPFVPKPYDILEQAVKAGFKYILLDRTPLLESDTPDRITVEKVPPKIYTASYPAWFFNREKLLRFFSEMGYEKMAEWDALAGMIYLGDDSALDKGFLFRRK